MRTEATSAVEPSPRRSRRAGRLALGVLLGGLAVFPLGCGGDDGGETAVTSTTGPSAGKSDESADAGEESDDVRQQVADEFKSGVNSGLGGSGAEVTDEQADCAAEGIIDALGVRRAAELNDTGDDINLTPEEARKVVPVVRRCLDFAELLAQGIVQGAEGKISQSAAGCLADKLENSQLVDDALTAAMTGAEVDPTQDEQSSKTLLDAMSACLSPEDLQKLGS